MANVLSQNEIDDLLNALSMGEDVGHEEAPPDPSAGVRIYDFRTANKFYKEQMRTLNIVFDNFAFLLANRLTGMLHTVCEIEVISVEEISFGEFNNSIPSPVVLGVIEMEPLSGSLLIELSSSLVYGFISRLFGGVADYTLSDKSFTEIETSIIENILYQTMGILKDSWEKITNVNPVLSRVEYSSQFTQIVEMNEPAAIVTLNVTLDEIQGLISICIPHLAVQPIAKQLNTVNWTLANQSVHRVDSKEETIRGQLLNTYVSLRAVFNDTQTSFREILNMQVGDVICINHSIREYINVNVEDIPKFKGVVGTDNNKYAVQIAKIVKENENIEQ